jgi:hypothetical protein
VEDAEKAKRKITEEYERDPEGWKVRTSRDRARFMDTMVTHDENMWYLKEYSINPYKTVGVAERKKGAEGDDPEFDFGLRELNDPALLRESGDIIDLLSRRPESPENIRSPYILEGPVLRTKDLSISQAQEKLDEKLRAELKRIIDRDYSHLSYPYL